MAIQKEINIDKPVEIENPTLSFSKLTPELSLSALTLHGDYYSDLQAKYMKTFLWSLPVQSAIAVIIACYYYYILKDYIEISESVGEFLRLVKNSSDLRVSFVISFAVLAVSLAVFGVIGMYITDEFKIISSKLSASSYVQYIFGFDLHKFSKLDNEKVSNLKEKKLYEQGENSQLVMFKDDPIGIISLTPLFDKSSDSNLVIRISGMNVRKAFRKYDFESLLLDFAVERSKLIYKQFLKDKKIKKSNGCKITLLIDGYSFDKEFLEPIINHNFSEVSSSYQLNPLTDKTAFLKGAVNKFLGITRKTFAVQVVDMNKDTK